MGRPLECKLTYIRIVLDILSAWLLPAMCLCPISLPLLQISPHSLSSSFIFSFRFLFHCSVDSSIHRGIHQLKSKVMNQDIKRDMSFTRTPTDAKDDQNRKEKQA